MLTLTGTVGQEIPGDPQRSIPCFGNFLRFWEEILCHKNNWGGKFLGGILNF